MNVLRLIPCQLNTLMNSPLLSLCRGEFIGVHTYSLIQFLTVMTTVGLELYVRDCTVTSVQLAAYDPAAMNTQSQSPDEGAAITIRL